MFSLHVKHFYQLCSIYNFPNKWRFHTYILCIFNSVYIAPIPHISTEIFKWVFLTHRFIFWGHYTCRHAQCSIKQLNLVIEVHAHIISPIAGRFVAEECQLSIMNACQPLFYNDQLQLLLYVKPYAVLYCQLSCLAQSNDVMYPRKSSWIKDIYNRVGFFCQQYCCIFC